MDSTMGSRVGLCCGAGRVGREGVGGWWEGRAVGPKLLCCCCSSSSPLFGTLVGGVV